MKELEFPIIMHKDENEVKIYEEFIYFENSITGAKSIERVRRHLPTLKKCIEGHVRCLRLRGYEKC